MWIKRGIEKKIKCLAEQRPALLLTGARQTGKTSLFKTLFQETPYLSLDLPSQAQEAETQGELFLKNHPSPLIIDEVQYAPGIFRYLKAAIDEQRQKKDNIY